MKKILTIALLLICLTTQAYQEKNLLQKQILTSNLSEVLLPGQKWVSYPGYEDREGWDKLMGNNKSYFIEQGEKYLDYQWKVIKATDYLEYTRSGNRSVMEGLYNDNTNAISRLFIAELAEGKGRFTDQLINGVFQACEMTTWSIAAHLHLQHIKGSFPDHNDQVIELVSGDVGAMMSWIYYFLNKEFDKVSPLISQRIHKEVDTRILTPYLEETRFWWMAVNVNANAERPFVNNWNPWCNANVLQCFLLMENDPKRLSEGVYKTMVSVDKFINYTNNDGACEEGPSYWGHAAGKLYDYLQILHDATAGKISIFSEPIVKNMGEYISRSYVDNDWVVNFADASAKNSFNYRLIYRYGNMTKSQEMLEFASYLKNKSLGKISVARDTYRILGDIASDREIDKYKPVHNHAPFTWYPETEFCYINDGRLFMAAKGGHNDESHNHNDVGTFSLYVDNEPVFIDAGVGTYTRQTFSGERYNIWTMQTDYHNLPLINGYPQLYGKIYKSSNVKADKNKKSFSLDLSKAYPEETGIKKWQRSYRILKGELHIEDVFDLNDPQKENQLNFMTWGTVDTSTEGVVAISVNGKKVELLYDKNTFNPVVKTINLDDPRLSNVWGDKIYRLSLIAKKTEKQGTYKIAIKAK